MAAKRKYYAVKRKYKRKKTRSKRRTKSLKRPSKRPAGGSTGSIKQLSKYLAKQIPAVVSVSSSRNSPFPDVYNCKLSHEYGGQVLFPVASTTADVTTKVGSVIINNMQAAFEDFNGDGASAPLVVDNPGFTKSSAARGADDIRIIYNRYVVKKVALKVTISGFNRQGQNNLSQLPTNRLEGTNDLLPIEAVKIWFDTHPNGAADQPDSLKEALDRNLKVFTIKPVTAQNGKKSCTHTFLIDPIKFAGMTPGSASTTGLSTVNQALTALTNATVNPSALVKTSIYMTDQNGNPLRTPEISERNECEIRCEKIIYLSAFRLNDSEDV